MRSSQKQIVVRKQNYLDVDAIYNFFLFRSLQLQYIEYSSFSQRLSGVLWIVYGASSVGKSTFMNSMPRNMKCIRLSADNILRVLISQQPSAELDFSVLISRMYSILYFILSKGYDLVFDTYSPESWFQFVAAYNLRVEAYYYFLHCSLAVQVDRVIQRNELACSLGDRWNVRQGYDSLRQSVSMFVACGSNDFRRVDIDLSRKTLVSNLARLAQHNYTLFSENRESLVEENAEVYNLIFNREESAMYKPKYPADFIINTEENVRAIINQNQLINSKIR